jgi:hypothetical protein
MPKRQEGQAAPTLVAKSPPEEMTNLYEDRAEFTARRIRLDWSRGQTKCDEGGQVQAAENNLSSGGSLRMISPVSDTFK